MVLQAIVEDDERPGVSGGSRRKAYKEELMLSRVKGR